jgi:hypothetical protein
MKEDVIALDKAIESGDTDLVSSVLLSLRKKLPMASYFRIINTRPVATALVESEAWDFDRELLKDLYYQDDRRLEGANLLFSEALDARDTTHRTEKLRSASKLLTDSRDAAFNLKSLDEAAKLLKAQDAIEKDFGTGFVGLSVNDTLFKLTRLGGLKRAQKLQTDFRVPEKAFWWLKLRALVSKRDWTELEELAGKTKKSPIGWEPFFNEILAAGNVRLAGVFVPKCTGVGHRDRVEMWVKCGLGAKAAEEAGRAKDLEGLKELRGKVAERDVGEVERWINVLGKK